jgi:hypothetical protein
MERRYVITIIIIVVLLIGLFIGSGYFIYQILHPPFLKKDINQLLQNASSSVVSVTSREKEESQNIKNVLDSSLSTSSASNDLKASQQFIAESNQLFFAWQITEGVNARLIRATVATSSKLGEGYILNLFFNVKNSSSTFCADILRKLVWRIKDESGTMIAPVSITSSTCLTSYEESEVVLGFNIPVLEEPLTFQITHFDPRYYTDNRPKTFFILKIIGNTISIEYPSQEG